MSQNVRVSGSSQDVRMGRGSGDSRGGRGRQGHSWRSRGTGGGEQREKFINFVSIPLQSAEVLENFHTFKEEILRECPDRGIEESLFTSPLKLHLTMGVMTLKDDEQNANAIRLLKEAKENIILPLLTCPLRLRIKGLSYWKDKKDDPSNIKVLYSCVEEADGPTGLLQNMMDKVVNSFVDAGVMKREHDTDSINIHMTVMNSANRHKTKEGSKNKPWMPFDGSRIIEKFKDYNFGVVEVKAIHISFFGSVGEDGYYTPLFVLPIFE